MEHVRLTVQLRDQANRVRLTQHVDVGLGHAKEKAAEIAGRMARYYKKEKQDSESE